MINRKKLRLFVLIGIVIIVILAGGVFFTAKAIKKQVAHNNERQQTQVKKSEQPPTSSSSNNTLSGDEKVPEKTSDKLSQKATLTQFLETFSTWKLNNTSIDNRAKALQTLMAPLAYQSNYIKEEADQLKLLLERYQKTKQIDTSNSTQLVSRQYERSNLYLNANSQGQYYVELYYYETPVYQTTGYTIEAKYNITMNGNQVVSLALLSQKSVPEGKINGNK